VSTGPRGEAPPTIVRLRITLRDVKPTVWRRLEVSLTATLADLHAAIQAAMGWEDVHLHCFRIFGRRYDSEHGLLSENVRLADLRLRSGERFLYVYNHSAPWEVKASAWTGCSSPIPARPAATRYFGRAACFTN
jgi:hypothetical protein